MRQANDVLSVRSNAHRSSDASEFVIDDDKSVRAFLELLIAGARCKPRSFNAADAFLACPRLMIHNCVVSDLSPPDLHARARRVTSQIRAKASFGSLKQINAGLPPSEEAAVALPHGWSYDIQLRRRSH